MNLSSPGKIIDVASAFGRLGVTSFGGPVAHIGYFRTEFVTRRGWLDDQAFGDLVALCQFLPGPASSQLAFALGMQRAGLAGALTASFFFAMPSAVLMILFGYGVGALGDLQHSGWLHGLKLAAVAVVAQAVLGMGRNLCPDIPRRALAILVVVVILLFPGALIQVGAIAAGATVGWLLYGKKETGRPDQILPGIQGHRMAIIALATFGVLLLGLPAAASATGVKAVAIFDSFYRAGALVFGGGHVVLPLLRAELVPRGWVTDDAFLAGYGAAQSLPGPLFTFASYLGTVMNPGRAASLSGLGCLFGIFLPGWLLIGGALPFWRRFQSKNWARAALQGANASVVGILAAAFYDPVWKQGVVAGRDIIIVAAAFMLLQFFRTPQWLVVGLAALAGWGWF